MTNPTQDQQQKTNAQQDAQRKGDAHRVVDNAAGGDTAGSEGGGWDPGESTDSTGPLQDGEKRGNTTRGDAGGGDHGSSR